jgi:cyclase
MTLKNPYKAGGMFEGASHLIFANATLLRKNMTEAEKALWVHLKAGINGLKIRRQHPIGNYIADFYCHKAKLIIEIDGEIHNDPAVQKIDVQREKDLKSLGYNVIRFSNEEVYKDPEKVLKEIEIKISELNTIINKILCKQQSLKAPFRGLGVILWTDVNL